MTRRWQVTGTGEAGFFLKRGGDRLGPLSEDEANERAAALNGDEFLSDAMSRGEWPPRGYEWEETASIYVRPDERYVVSLLVGYSASDAASPIQAAADALALTRGENSDGTRWFVYDRETQQMRTLTQREMRAATGDEFDPDSAAESRPAGGGKERSQ